MRVGVLLLLTTLLVGCTRAHYRMSADREVYPIVGERNAAAGSFTDRIELEPNPASRLADPTNPDKPPRPPDDPVAAAYMAHPNGMHGAHWPKKRIDWIENPGWEAGLPWGSNGKVKLDADKSFELALLHSREYQTALEQLYIVALALTLNRFEFETKWFLTNATDFTSAAPGTLNETNTLTSTSHLGFTQAFAAGGQLVVDFANSFVLEYTANNRTSVSSTFVANFVQPLLRNAGKRVRLELLTQAERDVLYAARDFYRFRKQFWATITTLDSGYLSLLLQVQSIRNAQANLAGQQQNLLEHEALLPGGKITTVQVDQAFQGYQTARASVAQSEATLQTSLDQFKLLLGIPPHIPIELDDSVLNPFVLTDSKLDALREAIDRFQKARYRDLDTPPTLADLRNQYREFNGLTERTMPFVEAVGVELKDWGKKLDPSDADDARRARDAFRQFGLTLSETQRDLGKLRTEAQTDAGKLQETKRKEGWEALVDYIRRLLTLADQIIGVQTQVRINKIELPAIQWKEEEALTFAKTNRLDLQSERARVTDAWRKVFVAANALKADLNLVASTNQATTIGENGIINFANDQAVYSVGVRFDGPLNRQAESQCVSAGAYRLSTRTPHFHASVGPGGASGPPRFALAGIAETELRDRPTHTGVGHAATGSFAATDPPRPRCGGWNRHDRHSQCPECSIGARNALSSGYINYEQLRVQLLLDLEALQLDSRGYPIDERRSLSANDFAADRGVAPGPAGPGQSSLLPRPRDGGPPARIAVPRN